jgi:hypothetical protein
MMEVLQKEHQRLWKRAQSSKTIEDVQSIINLLKEARDKIANGLLTRSPSSLSRCQWQGPVLTCISEQQIPIRPP